MIRDDNDAIGFLNSGQNRLSLNFDILNPDLLYVRIGKT